MADKIIKVAPVGNAFCVLGPDDLPVDRYLTVDDLSDLRAAGYTVIIVTNARP
jgi:hypothetical protein